MFSIARHCCSKIIVPRTSSLLVSQPSYKTNLLKNYSQSVLWRRQGTTRLLQMKNAFRGSGTVAIRLASEVSPKAKKTVGYWLLGCSGMVFVAVVLGIGIAYYTVLLSICLVLSEVIKRTIR